MDARAALEELARRKLEGQQNQALVQSIRAELLHPKTGKPWAQTRFADDTSRNKAALCTRRAGKTSTWPRYAPMVALSRPKTLSRIWGPSRLRAKELVWQELKDVCHRHRLVADFNETELSCTLSNGSIIRLVGADKDRDIQRKRGDKTVLEIILECQLQSNLQVLVEEVVEPCLFDERGTCCLEGTPGPVAGGYWFDVSGGDDFSSHWTSKGGKDGTGAGWSVHRWGVLDNPHLPHAREELEALFKKRNWTDATPKYLREWKARWVTDNTALYYSFDEKRNTYGMGDVVPWGPGWQHTLGLDIGSRDSMAVVVWGWRSDGDKTLYEAFSWRDDEYRTSDTSRGATITEVIELIKREEQRFNVIRRVIDTQGGGRTINDDILKRMEISFDAAQKGSKYDNVLLMNDDFLAGRIKLARGSFLANELATLLKDADWDPDSGKPPTEDKRCKNHCADAGLYAWREAYAYRSVEDVKPPARGTQEWYAAQESAWLEKRSNRAEKPWWESDNEYDDSLLYGG